MAYLYVTDLRSQRGTREDKERDKTRSQDET
jgi:hypothetical protein